MSRFCNIVILLLAFLPASSVAVTAEVEDVNSIARLYSAAFDRTPKVGGLNFWVDAFEDGKSLVDIARKFYESPEFTKKYGALGDRDYVAQLFRNVLLRGGGEDGIDFWTGHLANGVSRAKVLAEFADSAENIVKTADIFADMRRVEGQWVFEHGEGLLTEIVKDIVPGSDSVSPWFLIDFKHALYFTALNDGMSAMWRSDGTAEGTTLFKEFRGGDPGAFVVAGDNLFFRGTDYAHGTELWVSDGTSIGTEMTKDIWWGGSRGLLTWPMPWKGGVLFIADDGVAGQQFWTSDGTEAGTQRFEDAAISTEANARNFWLFEDGWLFKSTDPAYGAELWCTDGTEGGSKLVKDIVPGPAGSFPSDPFSLAQINGSGIFWVWKEDVAELWLTDGTESGTRMFWVVPDPDLTPSYRLISYKNMVLFFLQNSDQDWSLWRTDGTQLGTQLLKGGFIDEPSFSNFLEYDGFLYLTLMTTDRVSGSELWRTDGTKAGTQLFVDLNPGPGGSSPGDLTIYAGRLYFVADDGTLGEELYRTDGTVGGTELVADVAPGSDSSSPNELTVSQGSLFFSAWKPTSGRELYKTTTFP